eukprot:jgi/Bigna1/77046/fgenesh1_pg.45_\
MPSNVGVYLHMLVFGLGSWIAINGIYAELPFMVNDLPEGYAIAATLGVAIQLGNVAPLLYGVLRRRYGGSLAIPTTYFIFLIGIACCILLSIFWKHTLLVGGKRSSVALIVLTGGVAMVDSTSSVVFWPFASRFPSDKVIALATGEALSSTVPGILSLIQSSGSGGVCASNGSHPLFPVPLYFVALALVLLQQQQQQQHEEGLLDYVPSQYSANMSFSGTTEYKKLQAAGNIIESLERLDNDSGSETGEGRMLEVNGLNDLGVGLDDTSSSLSVLETTTRPRLSFAIYAVIAVLGFLQNGVLPTIIPLVSKLYTPCTYGATNSTALTLSPLFSLLVMWRPFRSQKEAVISTSAIGVGSLYILTLAFLQTRAPMSSTASGGYIHGMAIVIISCATAFTKSAAFLLVSRGGHSIAKSFPRRFKHGNSSPIAIVLGAEERGVVGNEEEDPRAEKQTGDQKSQGFIFHGNHRDDRGLDDGEGGEEGRRRRKRLEWAGIVTQVGSFVGAALIYIIVYHTDWVVTN